MFVPIGKIGWQATGTTFDATFIFADSLEHAHGIWERSGVEISVAGKISKDYGANELKTWPGHLAERWKRTVVAVYTDREMPASTQDWASVMHIIESVTYERD